MSDQEIRQAVRQAIKDDPNYADFMSLTGDQGLYDIESRVIAALATPTTESEELTP